MADWDSQQGTYHNGIRIPDSLPVPAGYKLVMIEHTHPPFDMFFGGYERGPSAADLATAAKYPGAFSVIHSGIPWYANGGSEYYYYGPRQH
jgi:hypothetical protein